jgi:tRNA G18 (ribose-2'-O)-methylase SpoU
MARKSGVAVSGQHAIANALRRPHEVAWVLVADDMAASAAAKLQHQVQAHDIRVMRGIDKQILSQALGGGERSAVLLKKSSLARTLKSELQRYVDVMGEV